MAPPGRVEEVSGERGDGDASLLAGYHAGAGVDERHRSRWHGWDDDHGGIPRGRRVAHDLLASWTVLVWPVLWARSDSSALMAWWYSRARPGWPWKRSRAIPASRSRVRQVWR